VLILLFIFLGLISLVLATLLSFAIALPAALFRTAVLVLTALLSLLTFPAIALLTALLAATLIALLTALLIFAIALLLVRLLALLICHLCSPFSSLTNRLNRENLELSFALPIYRGSALTHVLLLVLRSKPTLLRGAQPYRERRN
jgi:hypothetical protein